MNREKTWGPFYDGKGMELTVKLHYRGLWRIETINRGNPVFGKATMVIQIRDPKRNIAVDYAPEHDEICDAILEAMLTAELDNDTYTFEKGERRPTQIYSKINQIKLKLGEWEWKARQAGLKPPPDKLSEYFFGSER